MKLRLRIGNIADPHLKFCFLFGRLCWQSVPASIHSAATQLTLWKDAALRCTMARQRRSCEVSAALKPPTGDGPSHAVVDAAMRSSMEANSFGMSRSSAGGIDGGPNSIVAETRDVVVSADGWPGVSSGFSHANAVPENETSESAEKK
jgi:hypothetical protein